MGRLLIVTALLAVAGCRFELPSARLRCSVSSDCPRGQSCQDVPLAAETAVRLCCPSGGCALGAREKEEILAGIADAGTTRDAPATGPNDSGPTQDAPMAKEAPGADCTVSGCPARPGADATCQQGRCVYSCRVGLAACGGGSPETTGCETELATSRFHCGRCDRDCGDNRCSGGLCTPMRLWSPSRWLRLASDAGAFDGQRLYFADRDGMTLPMYIDKTGAGEARPVTDLWKPDVQKREVASLAPRVFGAHVYWSHGESTRTIERVGANGIETLVTGIDGLRPASVAVNGDYLYWVKDSVATGLATLQRRQLGPASARVEDVVTGHIEGVVYDRTELFFGARERPSEPVLVIKRIGLGDPAGAVGVFHQAAGHLQVLAADDRYLYFVETIAEARVIKRKGRIGPDQAELIASVPQLFNAALTVIHGDSLWFVERLHLSISTVPKAGGSLRRVVSATLASFGVDDTHVYWMDHNGHLYRTVK